MSTPGGRRSLLPGRSAPSPGTSRACASRSPGDAPTFPAPPQDTESVKDTTDPRPVGRPYPEAREHGGEHNTAAAVPQDDAPRNSFGGRSLHRPEEDVEDQSLAFDVGTHVSRRVALEVLGAGSPPSSPPAPAEANGVYERTEYAGSAENLDQLSLETDGIFSDGYEQQLASLSGDLETGYSFSLDVPIDTTTEPEVGVMGDESPAAPSDGGGESAEG